MKAIGWLCPVPHMLIRRYKIAPRSHMITPLDSNDLRFDMFTGEER